MLGAAPAVTYSRPHPMAAPSAVPPRPLAPDAAEVLDTPSAGRATVRGSAVRIAGYGVSLALSLVSAPLLVRHLGIAEFGRYTAVISLIALVGGVSDGGLTAIAIREWAMGRGEERVRAMRTLLGMRIALTAVGVAFAVAFAVVADYGAPLVLGTALAGAGLLALGLQQACSIPLQAELRLGWVTAADVVRQVVSVGLIVVLVVTGAGVAAFLAVPIPAGLAALGVTLVLVWRRLPLRPSFCWADWRALGRDTLPVATALALHHLYLRVVIVLMTLLATDLQTGYFATSFRIVEVLIAVPFVLAQTTLPVLARAGGTDFDRFSYALARLFEASAVVALWVSGCVVAGAPLAVEYLAGSRSGPVVAVLRLQSVALLLVFFTVTWQNALFALRRQGSLVASNAVGVGVTAGLTCALVPLLQARGAALAAVGGELALTVSSVVLLLRHRDRDRQLSLSFAFLPKLVLAAGLAALTFLVPGLPPVVRVVALTLVYAGALYALGAIPAELRQALAVVRLTSLAGRWRR